MTQEQLVMVEEESWMRVVVGAGMETFCWKNQEDNWLWSSACTFASALTSVYIPSSDMLTFMMMS